MHRPPKVGDVGEMRLMVDASHAIDFTETGMPPVLSTPTLIYYLENAGRQALLPLLEPGEACVGTHVDVHHLAATTVGHEVVFTARVVHAEGRNVTFQVEARDETDLLARGLHKRAVLEIARFAKHLERKMRS